MIVVIVVVVTGGKQSQLLASALGLGWSLTIEKSFQLSSTSWGIRLEEIIRIDCFRARSQASKTLFK